MLRVNNELMLREVVTMKETTMSCISREGK